MDSEERILGIIVAGGCAPGLNGIIAAATEFAHRLHWKVIGFQEGYKYLMTGDPEIVEKHTVLVTDELIQWKSTLGGSIIKTSRLDISKNLAAIANTFKMLKHFKIRYLLAIGGNDKIRICHNITQGVDPTQMQVIAIPKTISNDVELPSGQPSFGFHTARAFAAKLVRNLIFDAQSQPRWFIVELMGKETGHLAFTVAVASGADLAIIPEDFAQKQILLSDISDMIEGTIIKKAAEGINYGVIVICEGLLGMLNDEDKQYVYTSQNISNDPTTFSFSDVEISRTLAHDVQERLKKRNIKTMVTAKNIGYELRGARPLGFDAIYARELGLGAVNGFLLGHSNCVVIWNDGKIMYKSFRSIVDPITGTIKPRLVDTQGTEYTVGRGNMCFLTKQDFTDKAQLAKLAKVANTTTEQFLADFVHIPDLVNH